MPLGLQPDDRPHFSGSSRPNHTSLRPITLHVTCARARMHAHMRARMRACVRACVLFQPVEYDLAVPLKKVMCAGGVGCVNCSQNFGKRSIWPKAVLALRCTGKKVWATELRWLWACH